MLEQDIKNFEIIDNLVSNHFSLDKKGLELFKSALNDQNERKKYMPEHLMKYVGDDLRLRIPLSEPFRKKLDLGWTLFQSAFYDFAHEFSPRYSDYARNKLKLEKSEVKLFKFMKKWYSDYIKNSDNSEETKSRVITGIHSALGFPNLGSNPLSHTIFDELTYAFEKIGESKLPNNGLEVVVSFNFADWFMCSTAEKWTSCLNLESDYESAYWSGLPGLIIDPNRVMIYVTDGSKKSYQGIEVDKMIQRTWALIDSDDEKTVVPQRHYPQKFISDNNFASLFPFKVSEYSMSDYGRFESNVPMSKMITNYLDETVFIYQDVTEFISEESGLRIIGGSSGMHKMTEYSIGGQIDEDTKYSCTCGLSGLIGLNKEIEEFEGEGIYCEDCGCSLIEDEECIGSDGLSYCSSCFHESFAVCEDCGESVRSDECIYVGDGVYCESCHDRNFTICDECGESVRDGECIYVGDDAYCESCHNRNFTICDECGESVRDYEIEVHKLGSFCKICFDGKFTHCPKCDEMVEKCDIVLDGDREVCISCAKGKEDKREGVA